MDSLALDDKAFHRIREFLFDRTGITLGDEKRPLVSGRLTRRLVPSGCKDFGSYASLLTSGLQPDETRTAIDLLTTNETHFFREPGHFEALREYVRLRDESRPLRVWSAACSSGEEPYSIAMVLSDCLGEASPWEVVASDISSRVLDHARQGVYAGNRLDEIPKEYLRRYCLKGIGGQNGRFMIDPALRSRVRFLPANLNEPLPEIGRFDLVFLRNVMIYFNAATRSAVVKRVAERLQRGGWLIVGHAESLQGVHDGLQPLRPTIYRRAR